MLTINEIEKLPIVFIIGRGRSGTTLLQTIMDAHPSIITANESPFIINLKQKYSKVNQWSSEKIDEFIIDLYKDKQFAFLWNIDQTILRSKINLYDITQLNFSTLCKLVYLTIPSPFPKNKISLIVDKNPIYSFYIEELIELFPNAKFIHLVRDYRDNIISSRKAFKTKDVALLAQRWKRQNMFIDFHKKNNAALFLTLQYEKLVTDPEKHVSEVCSFINITFNPNMLDFHKTTTKIYNDASSKNDLMTNIVKNIHLNLLNPVNCGQVDKWKEELTNSEIEIIDYIAGGYAKKYDYMSTTKVKGLSYYMTAIKSHLKYSTDYYINKIYYRIPMTIRDLSRTISQLLYDKFGYINKHNKLGALYRKV